MTDIEQKGEQTNFATSAGSILSYLAVGAYNMFPRCDMNDVHETY